MFKHTATMMGHKQQEVDANVGLREEAIADAKAEWALLSELRDSRGWAAMVERLGRTEMELLQKLELTQDPIAMAKLVGSLLATKGQATFVERRLLELKLVLEDLE